MSSNERPERTPNNKKAVIIFLSVAVSVGIISGILLLILNSFEGEREAPITNMYSDELHSYIFYKPDYDLDVTTVPEYMEKDRLLYYKNGGVEIGIDGNAEDYGPEPAFFERYFDAVIKGDVETYRTMFTANYNETVGEENGFAPQMLYDMHVERLRVQKEDGTEPIAFNVSYKIYRNNGTFRNDIDSDASKVLYFELAYEDGELKVDRITYYK